MGQRDYVEYQKGHYQSNGLGNMG